MRVGIVAAEPSGDRLAAGLMAELSRRRPDIRFEGIGGAAMQAQGLEPLHPMEQLSVMGLVEVLKHLPGLLALRRDLVRRWSREPPDLFIGVDAPDFNLALERAMKRQGVPTVHYVSPTVWAWREGRTRKLRQAADRVLCIFPFEKPFLEERGVGAEYVGHPLASAYPLEPDREAARGKLGLDPQRPVLALLPGSRVNEVQQLAAPFLDAACRLHGRIEGLQVATPVATPRTGELFREIVAARAPELPLQLHPGATAEVLAAADAALVASGTATFEALLSKCPMVVGYRMNPLTYRIITGLGMLKTEHVAMANLLCREPLAPEFLQEACTGENLAGALGNYFEDPELTAQVRKVYGETHRELVMDTDALAANAVLELVEG